MIAPRVAPWAWIAIDARNSRLALVTLHHLNGCALPISSRYALAIFAHSAAAIWDNRRGLSLGRGDRTLASCANGDSSTVAGMLNGDQTGGNEPLDGFSRSGRCRIAAGLREVDIARAGRSGFGRRTDHVEQRAQLRAQEPIWTGALHAASRCAWGQSRTEQARIAVSSNRWSQVVQSAGSASAMKAVQATSAPRAAAASMIRCQYFGGILPRLRHWRTRTPLSPISAASASAFPSQTA